MSSIEHKVVQRLLSHYPPNCTNSDKRIHNDICKRANIELGYNRGHPLRFYCYNIVSATGELLNPNDNQNNPNAEW